MRFVIHQSWSNSVTPHTGLVCGKGEEHLFWPMLLKTGFAVLLLFGLCSKDVSSQDVSAIMGAMPEEISVLKEMMQNLREVRVEGLPFWEGRLQNRNVVLVQS